MYKLAADPRAAKWAAGVLHRVDLLHNAQTNPISTIPLALPHGSDFREGGWGDGGNVGRFKYETIGGLEL
jgi:hypothetical protein